MKKQMIITYLITFAFLASLPAAGQNIKTEKKADKLKEQVQAMNDKLARANVNNDLETVYSMYADDIVYMPNNGPLIRGKESMKAFDKQMMESGARMSSMTLSTLEVTDMGATVYEIGTYAISMDIPGLDHPWADKGKYVSIYRKLKDGSLEMIVDIWNTDVNPWSAGRETEKTDNE